MKNPKNMKIKYENKPSEEVVDKYCKKLEEFLSAHNTSVFIKLLEYPLRIESYINGNLDDIKNIWVDRVIVKNQKFGELYLHLLDGGIEEDLNERNVWNVAWDLQNQIYQQLKLTIKSPGEFDWENDPYWKLWDQLKRIDNQK